MTERIAARLGAVAAPLLIPFGLTHTFAAFDWLMSLEPGWYSTIFGVYSFSGSLLAAFAFLVARSPFVHRAGLLRGVVTVEHLHDLGKLLFAFTVFWAYIAFSQYFLIWYGNIPEETIWYHDVGPRARGRRSATLLAVGHFVMPFFFLLPRRIKRTAPTARGGGALAAR